MSLFRFAPGSLLLLCAAATLGGCCTPSSQPARASGDTAAPTSSPASIQIGRYTSVAPLPEPDEQDLLLQIVDVSIPAYVMPTVGEALRYVLLRSGYRLCSARQEITELDLLPLPAAHLHIGPLHLVDAMKVLVGSAWTMESDGAGRIVCFARRTGPTTPASPADTFPMNDEASSASAPEQRP